METGRRFKCAACNHVLNWSSELEPDGTHRIVEWIHPARSGEDHEPIPVEIAEDDPDVDQICDFCSAPDPEWCAITATFSEDLLRPDGSTVHTTSHGDWATCTACKELIERRDWVKLSAQSAQSLRFRSGIGRQEWRRVEKEIDRQIQSLHREFIAAWTGQIVPIVRMRLGFVHGGEDASG